LLLEDKITIKWNSKVKNHYVNLGYACTKQCDEIEVYVKDLSYGSGACIKLACDSCNDAHEVLYCSYVRSKVYNENGLGSYICQSCSVKSNVAKLIKSNEEFIKEIYVLVGNEFIFLEEYKGAKIKIKIKHNVCEDIFYIAPTDFLKGNRCPKCSKKKRKNTDIFKQEVSSLVGSEYDVLGEYKNTATKIKMKHNTCENTYKVTPKDFLRGSRCPICKESKGEQTIRKYLQKSNIIFISQYQFEDCRRIYPLPFDFAIFNEKENLLFLIEYDGVFHYENITGLDNLKYTQGNDKIKNKYCLKNNIDLLRIPYWEFDNIEDILKNKFFEMELPSIELVLA
jgi:Zn ribbon nucleic-acid-binding protein